MPAWEDYITAAFPRTVAATYDGGNFPRRALAGALDAASMPGRAWMALADAQNDPTPPSVAQILANHSLKQQPTYIQSMAQTQMAPSLPLAERIGGNVFRDPTSILGPGLGEAVGAGAAKLGSGILGRILAGGADAASQTGLQAANQYGTNGSVDSRSLALTAGLMGAGSGIGAGVSSVAPKARAALLDNPNFQKWFGGSNVVDEAGGPLSLNGVYVNSDSPILPDAINGKRYAQFYDIAYKEGQTHKSSGVPLSISHPDNAEFLSPDLMDYHIQQGADRYTWDALRSGYRDGHNGNPRGYTSAKAVVAKRIGEVPESGVSMNFREQKAEPGLSVLGVYENGEYVPQNNSTFEMFNNGPKRNVMGYKSENWIGSDGESVLLRPVDLGPDGSRIKSAIGNRGTFDPTDPNITHLVGGGTQLPAAQGGFAQALAGKYLRGMYLNQSQGNQQ